MYQLVCPKQILAVGRPSRPAHVSVSVRMCSQLRLFSMLLLAPPVTGIHTSQEMKPRCPKPCPPGVLLAPLPHHVVRKPDSPGTAFSPKLLSSPWKHRAEISGAADMLGVCIIYQTLGLSAPSQRSQKELAALPTTPKPEEGRVFLALAQRPLAHGVKQQHSGTCWPQKASGWWKGPK